MSENELISFTTEGLRFEDADTDDLGSSYSGKRELEIPFEQHDNKIKSSPSWLEPITRRDKDFENTGKPRFSSSNSLSSGIFRENSTNKEWLGKSSTSNKELSEVLALKERIAADIYAYYGVQVPKIELALQKMTNIEEFPNLEGKESIHVMSELMEGFITYQEAFGKNFKVINPNPNQEIILPDGTRLPERGLGNILAVAMLINDIDVIGASGGNIGYQIISHPLEEKYAQTIKIDPGEAFANNEVSGERKIRVAFTGTPKETELDFDELPNGTKREFLATLHRILQTNEATFRRFFVREGAPSFITFFHQSADELTRFLMDRKSKMMKEYREYLDYAQRIYEGEEEEEKYPTARDIEWQTRANEAQAYQEELLYYIEPIVIDADEPLERVKLWTAIDQFLDFEKESISKVLLLKGESGSGKSLALRFLELELLEKRRMQKNAPMPIHINLNKFNIHNIKDSFDRTLNEKYYGEYDPNKSRLVVLMDGYDEIAGGCQLNLYSILQLERYSKILKVIITCRTQYLTSGYRKWFKPAIGQLKELELQQFDDDQISDYLRKYSGELVKAGRETSSFMKYQEILSNNPFLKELIGNPFMLRLVAESSPRLNHYILSKEEKTTTGGREREETHEDTKLKVLNRYTIYEYFMEHWFAKQEIRLMQRSETSGYSQGISAFRVFSMKVALLLLSKREVESKFKDDPCWKDYFGDSDLDVVKARNACPLKRTNDHQYSFIHKPFLEYFAAKGILNAIIDDKSSVSEAISISPDWVTQDTGVISFLRDAFAMDPRLTEKCLERIEKSKVFLAKDEETRQNAAQAAIAITLLNVVNYDFNKLNLSNICVPNANLAYGIFEETNFSNADLTNVNFAGASLKNAIFRDANLTNTNFGEWPYLEFEAPIRWVSFSNNGELLAAAVENSVIIFRREAKTGMIYETKKIREKSGNIIEYCEFNADGKRMIISCKDGTSYILDIATEEPTIGLDKSFGDATKIYDFSPDGNQVAFSRENSLLIWNFAIKAYTHEFKGHKDKITCFKFSPDGSQIVSGSLDRTIRIWDVSGRYSARKQVAIGEKGLNLSGANIEGVMGLSNVNLMLLYQRGACGFSEKEQERFIGDLNESIGDQGKTGEEVDLSLKSINDESACGIGKYATWTNLMKLDLSRNHIGNKGAIGLGANSTWSNLRNLNLNNNKIGDEGAEGLSKNITWTKLELLTLKNNQISDIGARALSENTNWKKLKNIYLENNRVSSVATVMRNLNGKFIRQVIELRNSNLIVFTDKEYMKSAIQQLNEEFHRELGRYKDERRVEFLDILGKRKTLQITGEDLRKEGVIEGSDEQKVHSFWMPYIRSLDLTEENIGAKGIESLCRNADLFDFQDADALKRSKFQKKLLKLKLSRNKIGDEGCKPLVESKAWINLEELDLSMNGIGELGAEAIGRHSQWTKLKTLDLSRNNTGDQGCLEIAKNTTWRNLETLSLSNNLIGAVGAVGLGGNTTWHSLKILSLGSNQISDEGSMSLARNETFRNLEKLDLSSNCIKDKGAVAIGSSPHWMNLKALFLAKNQLSDETIGLLTGPSWRRSLETDLPDENFGGKFKPWLENPEETTEVVLKGKSLKETYAYIIAYNSTWTHLQTLDLSQSSLSDECGEEIGKNTSWTNLEKLNLSCNEISDRTANAIGNNQTWRNLKSLKLNSNKISDEGGMAIGRNPTWTNLETLNLRRNSLGDRATAAIATNLTWTQLKKLDLSYNEISDEGAEAIGSNTSWKELKKLLLSRNKIGDKGAIAIANSTAWRDLTTLDLSDNFIGDEGALYIGNNKIWENLKALYLSNNPIQEETIYYIRKLPIWKDHLKTDLSEGVPDSLLAEIASKSPENVSTLDLKDRKPQAVLTVLTGISMGWNNLESINLSSNNIGESGSAIIGKNRTWKKLKRLCLGNNMINDEGVSAIAKNKTWINLEDLDLSRNEITEKGAIAIGISSSWKNLKKLSFKANEIGDEGCRAISCNRQWENLEYLDLSFNMIGDQGAQALGQNSLWKNLKTLILTGNNITNYGAKELCKNTTWTKLQTLELLQNQIGEIGARALVRKSCWESFDMNKAWTNLEEINLSHNIIGNNGVLGLGLNSSWSNLRRLIAHTNKIGEKGAASIAANPIWQNLEELDLSSNEIGDEGAIALARNSDWRQLKKLHLGDNNIGEEGGCRICSNESWVELQELALWKNKLGNNSAIALGRNEKWIKLRKLNLSFNEIQDEGGQILGSNTSWSRLEELYLTHNQLRYPTIKQLIRNPALKDLKTVDITFNMLTDSELNIYTRILELRSSKRRAKDPESLYITEERNDEAFAKLANDLEVVTYDACNFRPDMRIFKPHVTEKSPKETKNTGIPFEITPIASYDQVRKFVVELF